MIFVLIWGMRHKSTGPLCAIGGTFAISRRMREGGMLLMLLYSSEKGGTGTILAKDMPVHRMAALCMVVWRGTGVINVLRWE